MARVGLFGGTFNPIHVGHLMIAEEARLAAKLDRVVFIPSGESYFKDPAQIASREDRLAMTKLACAGRYEVSDIEIRREGPSYTSGTCRAFHEANPGDALFLILGADSLLEIDQWHDPAAIFDSATVLAFARGGEDRSAFLEKAEALRNTWGARVEVHEAFSLEVASSEIRRWIREGHAFRHLVTEPVAEYIRRHGLYGHHGIN